MARKLAPGTFFPFQACSRGSTHRGKTKNRKINMKPQKLILIPILIICFALAQSAQAVSPAPDGGYPGGNTAEGQAALLSLTTGGFNTAVGFLSLRSGTTNSFNTAIGAGTLVANTSDNNTAVGAGALLSNITGNFNTANGAFALLSNTSACCNVAIGAQALQTNTTGEANTANGGAALEGNTTGSGNTASGNGALSDNTTGTENIALGHGAGFNITTANHVIAIGSNGANVNNSCFIGQIRGQTTQNNDAIPVLVDSAGQLGTANSSRRYKTDIKPIDKASESILALKPVSFRYKVHKDRTPQFGLIAEEVADVNPDLVIYDADDKPYTVRYDAVNAMLLNEFLKEHCRGEEQDCKIQEQEKTIAELRSEIRNLAAMINEQASELRKVSAQLQTNNAAVHVVSTNSR